MEEVAHIFFKTFLNLRFGERSLVTIIIFIVQIRIAQNLLSNGRRQRLGNIWTLHILIGTILEFGKN